MKHKLLATLLSCTALVSCVDDDDDGGGSESYENRVRLTCNGQVLVDMTFTSRAACEQFRANNEFSCSGIELPISC